MNLRLSTASATLAARTHLALVRKVLFRRPRPTTLSLVDMQEVTLAPVNEDVGEELHCLAQSLAAATRRMEPDFVQLAGALTALHQQAVSMSTLGRSLAGKLLGTLQENRFTGDEGLATVSLRQLDDVLERSSDRLRILSAMTQLITELETHGSAIERIAFMLQSSVCSFAVESSRTAESRESFSDFVAGLRDLSAKMRNLGETIVEHCRVGLTEQAEATGEMAAALSELRQLAPQAANAVKAASARVQEMLDSSQSSLVRIEKHACTLSAHAGTAVYFLQFGDIIRQKLEHIVEALAGAAAREARSSDEPALTPPATAPAEVNVTPCAAVAPESAPPSTESPSSQEKARALDQILCIQIAQLEAIREEATAAHAQLSSAFSHLAEESERLVNEIGVLAGSTEGAVALQSLQHDIRQLQSLQHRGEAVGAKSVTSAQRVTQLSATLSAHVGDVTEMNRDLHLQALNAIVKTAWLGEIGATLGVLATHVHDTSKDSTGSVDRILKMLGGIQELTTSLATADFKVHDNAQKALEQGLTSLSLLSEQFEQSFARATQGAAAQSAVIKEAGSRLLFLNTFAENTSVLVKQISTCRAKLAPRCGAAPGKLETAAPSLANYTMESEREIHRRVLGKKADESFPVVATALSPSRTPTEPLSPSAATSDLGDNVELF